MNDRPCLDQFVSLKLRSYFECDRPIGHEGDHSKQIDARNDGIAAEVRWPREMGRKRPSEMPALEWCQSTVPVIRLTSIDPHGLNAVWLQTRQEEIKCGRWLGHPGNHVGLVNGQRREWQGK